MGTDPLYPSIYEEGQSQQNAANDLINNLSGSNYSSGAYSSFNQPAPSHQNDEEPTYSITEEEPQMRSIVQNEQA